MLQTLLPFPGKSTEAGKMGTGISEAGSTVKGSMDTSPSVRSRNALKVILDLDEDFGRIKMPNEKGWRSLPRAMGGGGLA